MQPFQKVKLITDKYLNEGLKQGDIGFILEKHDEESFEVQFFFKNSDESVWHTFNKQDLELADDEGL